MYQLLYHFYATRCLLEIHSLWPVVVKVNSLQSVINGVGFIIKMSVVEGTTCRSFHHAVDQTLVQRNPEDGSQNFQFSFCD